MSSSDSDSEVFEEYEVYFNEDEDIYSDNDDEVVFSLNTDSNGSNNNNNNNNNDNNNNNNTTTNATDSTVMDEHIAQDIKSSSWSSFEGTHTLQLIFQREISIRRTFSDHDRVRIMQGLLPHNGTRRLQYDHQVFCGQFSQDGRIFMSACQDRHLRLYDSQTWRVTKDILARNIGWSIIDTDYSPDQRWLIYSSWSDFVHLCNINGDFEIHDALDFMPDSDRFCLFSIKFSPDSNEILGGSSDRHLYIYDLNRKERTVRVEAHEDDINSVCFMDPAGQLIVSGSDDKMVKVWDRRLLGTGSYGTGCVGVFPGHTEGITHVSPKGDGRYLISNGKDQVIKLWDLRTMLSPSAHKGIGRRRLMGWDYRSGLMGIPQVLRQNSRHPNDNSIMTYRGHRVLQTLIRAYFSPQYSTGQKYIYTGSYDGNVYMYDVLTGNVVCRLRGHRAIIRDLSWHPTDTSLATTSWDGTVMEWTAEEASPHQRAKIW